MHIIRIITAFVVLLLAAVAVAQTTDRRPPPIPGHKPSPPPATSLPLQPSQSGKQSVGHPPNQETTTGQQRTGPNQRSTDQTPPTVKGQPAAQVNEEPYQDTPKQPSNSLNSLSLADTIAAIAAAAAFLQFITLVATVAVLVRTARRQLRAYVYLDEATVFAADVNGAVILPQAQLSVGTRPTAMIKFKNTGQTPAYDVAMYGEVAFAPWPLEPIRLPAIDFARGATKESLGPGAVRNKWHIPPDHIPAITDADIARLQNGELALFVYGEVRYKDVFRKNRFTRYRYFTGGPTGLRGLSLAGHDEGNEAN